MKNDEFVIVGKLGRPRGLDGEIYITPITDFPDRFLGLKQVFVREADEWRLMDLVSVEIISKRPVVKFDSIDTPEEAGRLTNRELAVKRAQVVDLPGDTYYIFDLIGCQVTENNSGAHIGAIIEVEQYPANDVYVIADAEGSISRLPVVKKFVIEVNIEKKRVTIDPSGLIRD